MSTNTKESVDAELLERYVLADLENEIGERRLTKFDGELKLKMVFRDGLLAELHTDDHKRVTGENVRQLAAAKAD